MSILTEIGLRVKRRREELGFSQEKLAEILGYKSKASIFKIEAGITDLPQSKFKELADALKTNISYLLDGTEKISRSDLDINSTLDFMEIPLYASISAGYGSSNSDFIETIAVPGLKPNGTTYFAVKVNGDSMEPKIPNGSVLIIKKDIVIENGDIGAFCYNDESYVKQKKIINNKLILHSININYDPMIVSETDCFKEYGKVVKVLIDL